MKADTSWIVPFLGDLKAFADENGLRDFSKDVSGLIEAHRDDLCKGSPYPPREGAGEDTEFGVTWQSARFGQKAH
ncbi:MAG: hypothetical protein AAF566_13810 [Pseudomonadota bacterium]